MKRCSRFLAVLLVVAMVASFSSAFALDKYQYTKYKQYLCVGDSVAAGYTYSGSWDNYGFTRVRGAYHDIVANAVDADLLQYATSGFRLIELRYMMDGKATDPDDFWQQCFGSSYMSPAVLDGYTEMFRDGIKSSDLMSINLGSNDILTASAMKFIFALNGAGDENKSELIKSVEAYLDKLAESNPNFSDLVKLAKTAGSMPSVLKDLITNLYNLFTLYKENWEATMKTIFTDLNPDITMLVLSVYNPAYKIYLDDNHALNLGPIVQPVINMINHYMQYESSYASKYTFVNVDGVDSWGMSLKDPDYFTYFVWSMHPTRLGHTDIAYRMLKVLPEHWVDIEFSKQPENVTAQEGETASFSVETKYGNTPYYQWQTAPKGSDQWTDIPAQEKDDAGNPIPGANPTAATATLKVTADKALDGQQYRCVVTDFYGQRAPITSDAATLTVTQKADPAPQPSDDPDPQPSDDPDPKPSDEPDPQPAKELPFVDVNGWSYDDIAYVYDRGLMDGKDDTHFDPTGTTTRAEFATVIYRMAGKPEVTQEMRDKCKFTDLTQDWYKDAVIWAFSEGVVNGITDTTFCPTEKITREQMVAMLYRYTKNADAAGDLSKIPDAAKISDYAKPAVAWAVANGVVNGMPDGSFDPKGNATREQMAAIMARYDKLAK